jgi:TfoX/Sxy family transcriptional regulator of competence genes
MVCSEEIETRRARTLSQWENTSPKKMFGGVCHLLNGNMFCGVYEDFLILRLGEPVARQALKEECVKPFDITGRPMKGWVMIRKQGFETERALAGWLKKAKDFTAHLPPK